MLSKTTILAKSQRTAVRRTPTSLPLSTAGPAAASAKKPPPAPPSISKLRSRRVVERQQQQQRRRLKQERPDKESAHSDEKSKRDDKPWPKSVVYGAWGVGAVAVPYACAWLSLIVPSVRRVVWEEGTTGRSKVPRRLRRYFGHEDWDAVAYVDVLNGEGITDLVGSSGSSGGGPGPGGAMPYRLPGELSAREREAAVRAEEMLAPGREVRARLIPIKQETSGGGWLDENRTNDYDPTTFGSTGGEGVLVSLPASLRARPESLLQCLTSEPKHDSSAKIATLAIEFLPDQREQDEEKEKESADTFKDADSSPESVSMYVSQGQPSSSSETSRRDPLIRSIHTYSTWYYQPPLQHLQSSSSSDKSTVHHVTASITDEEVRIRTLEADVRRLEAELRDLGNATRPYDDILDELEHTRSSLRRLRRGWRRWVPW